jgi:hypothetical protein
MNVNDHEYGEYYKNYIELVQTDSMLDELHTSVSSLRSLLIDLSIEQSEYRYADGKWSIKELIQHLIDTEKVFIYRALRFVRSDRQELLGYDHDEYVAQSKMHNRTIVNLLDELVLQRKLTIEFFKYLDQEDLMKSGRANGSNLSVRAIGYIQIGHVLHHTKIIKERYL